MTSLTAQIYFLVVISCFSITLIDADKCPVTRVEAEQSSDKILFFGDRAALIPKNNNDVEKYCKMVKENLKVTLSYARCLKPFPKTVLGMAFVGFKKFTKKRCADKKWREDFVKLGKCMHRENITETLHKCTDLGSIAFDYVFDYVTLKDQILFGCCVYGAIMSECFREKASKCGKDLSTFAYNLQNEPTQDAFNLLCSSLNTVPKCKKKFPKYLIDIHEYLKTPHKLNTNVMSAAMRVMLGDDSILNN